MDAGSDLCGGEAVARVGCMSAHLLAASGSRLDEESVNRSHGIGLRASACSQARNGSSLLSHLIGRCAVFSTRLRKNDCWSRVLRSNDMSPYALARARAINKCALQSHGTRVREGSVNGCSHGISPCASAEKRVLRSNHISPHPLSRAAEESALRSHGIESGGPVACGARALDDVVAARSNGTDQLARHR